MNKNTLLEYKAVRRFVESVSQDVKKYFGKDKSCIIGLEDDGVFYGEGLYQWLSKENKNITYTTMEMDGEGLEEEKVKGRKVLLVDNDVVTGKAYRTIMELMRSKRKRLNLVDIKYATLCDRVSIADFSVEDYPVPISWNLKDLDKIDLEIIKALSQEGRRSFVSIAQATGLTPVGVKNRVEKLIKQEILKIRGLLNIEKFYSVAVSIGINASPKTISKLAKKFENCPLVYSLVQISSGHHNLIIGLVASDLKRANDLIVKQIRSEPEIRDVHINFGEPSIIPKEYLISAFLGKKCLCEKRCNECEYFL